MGNLVSYLAGILFGLGLIVSKMVEPSRVIGFLDLLGTWDPTLLFVMVGGLIVMFVANFIARFFERPIRAEYWRLPAKYKLDKSLILGSAVFGIGWGIGGFCPGPIITSTGFFDPVLLTGLFTYFLGVAFALLIRNFLDQRRISSQV